MDAAEEVRRQLSPGNCSSVAQEKKRDQREKSLNLRMSFTMCKVRIMNKVGYVRCKSCESLLKYDCKKA